MSSTQPLKSWITENIRTSHPPMGGVLNGTLSHPFGTPWRVQVGEKNPMQQAKIFPNCSYSWIQKTIHPSPTLKTKCLKKKNSILLTLGKINKKKHAIHPSIPQLSLTQPTANLRGFVFQDPQAAFTARSWKHGPWIRWFSGLVLRDFVEGRDPPALREIPHWIVQYLETNPGLYFF